MANPSFRDVVALTLDIAVDHPTVMLKCVLEALEAHPTAWPAIGVAADTFAAFMREAYEREAQATDAAAREAQERLDAILKRK